jgi:hypothetical protein
MFKNLSRLAVPMLFVAALGAQSCSKSEVAELEAPEQTSTSANVTELKQFISRTTGTSIDKIAYSAADKTFTIDGDVTMTVSEATEHFNQEASNTDLPTGSSASTQRKSFYTIARSKATTVTLYADATVPAVWLPVIDQAIANWNNTNSLLKISRTTSSTAKIKVSGAYTVSGTIATAVYPDYLGNPGKTIKINTYHNGLDASMKLFAITHELGHNFGFTHTDGTYGNIINGTPVSDPNSVMNSVCLPWSAFTAYDLKAVVAVYPR